MIERVVQVGDLPVAVAEAGSGGRPLLLVHGFTGAKEDLSPWLDRLADAGWHAVAPDLRGHGASGKPTDPAAYSFAVYTADLVGLLDALGWASATLVGHSMGGMIVQHVAIAHPERVSALVLMDTSGRAVALDPEIVELGVAIVRDGGIAAYAAVLNELDDETVMRTEAERRMLADPEYVAFGERKLASVSADMFMAMLPALAQRPPVLDALAAVRMPTLVIVGEQDDAFVSPSEELARTIPGARLAVLPGAGHCPQFEAPASWEAVLFGFLAGLAADRPRPGDPSTEVLS